MGSGMVTRRGFLRSAGVGAAALAFGAGGNLAGERSRRPNIIFLLTDDQRWDTMSCAGNPVIRTPNMDALAAGGVRFSNAFVTTSICAVSRASFFSGQYARRHGIHGFAGAFSESAWSQTYPAQLKQLGYRTGFIGKFGVGPAKSFPVETFDYWKGIAGQPRYEHKDEQGRYKHLTQIMGEQSIEFLEGCSADRPFCLSVSFKAPHVQDGDPRQFIYDPVYKDLYKDAKISVPKTASKEHFATLPEFLQDDKTTTRVRWKLRFATPEAYQESVKSYYRLITGVDVVIGKIREELARRDMAEDTIIILMGDNGFFLGEHGFAGKWYGYEESIRVPLVVYDPRLPEKARGQVRDEMALNIDVAPTILEMAGAAVPGGMQGEALTELVHGRDAQWRKDFFYEHLFVHRPGGKGANLIPQTEGVVSGRYKYLRYIEKSPPYEQLFDLETDPHEEVNLAGDPEYKIQLGVMRRRWQELRLTCR